MSEQHRLRRALEHAMRMAKEAKERRKREILRRLQTPPEQPSPLGEYFEQPLGTGEYVDEPIGAHRFGWYVETKP